MVWNQYIYEANVGYETENNSEDEIDETLDEYSGEDWEDDFPDDIRFMWNSICTLLYDAHIEHSGNLCDFIRRRGLSNKILTNASFNNFVHYAKNIMCIY